MNNTALGAESIIFISEAHEKFYYEKLKEVRYQDVYHKALCYLVITAIMKLLQRKSFCRCFPMQSAGLRTFPTVPIMSTHRSRWKPCFPSWKKGFWKSRADLPRKRKKKIHFHLEEKQSREERDMFTTGDKLLNVMKEEEIGIAELSRISGVPERIILGIMAGVKEPELGVMCKIAEGLGICVHELRADEERYAVSVPKDTLAKLIVVSEINNVELEELIHTILEKGIEEQGFYE